MCNGIDDNCDSLTDEGFPVGELCSAGIGACYAAGQYVCNAQGTGVDCTAVAGTPTAEVCDGIDNNCNAEVDEGFSVGSACTDGGLGICQGTGVFICNNDGTGVTCDITNPGSVA